MTLNFNTKRFLSLSLVFILMTVIGTLSHEMGHYISAEVQGFNARINYGMTMLEHNTHRMTRGERFLFTLGGPVQTMLTGSIGVALLYIYRKTFRQKERLTAGQWIMIFTSLFWLRQVSNLCTWTLYYFINGKFGTRGDEIKIARYLELPKGSILLVTAVVGSLVLGLVVFKFIPKTIRLTFIMSGLIGGVSGYILWLKIFGPLLMP